MQLEMHPTSSCYGPFSATTDIEIARGFATTNGCVLEMTSKYPRLETDYYFDASQVKNYFFVLFVFGLLY